ncbi:MAG: cobalamin-dependent protein [Clostridia bacterium]|nr:cobalamin-dependent protein [Clostridia bacterium]MBR6512738.1 cobalamin-dependent protein [Clostridia bacterium]
MADFAKLKEAMGDLEEDIVVEIIDEVVASGKDAQAAVDACSEGMSIVGDRFEAGEYFVSDLIYAGEIMTDAVQKLSPMLAADAGSGASAKLILATVKDDLHDIGKNIVKAFLEASGFEVVDLGIDVPAQKIVDTAKEQGIKIICLSGVLTLALDSMKAVCDAFTAAGMRDDVKILIGGNPVSAEACAAMKADAWAHSPSDSIKYCKEWAGN